jgi:hypothetical protein
MALDHKERVAKMLAARPIVKTLGEYCPAEAAWTQFSIQKSSAREARGIVAVLANARQRHFGTHGFCSSFGQPG